MNNIENENIEKTKLIDQFKNLLFQKQNDKFLVREYKDDYLSLCNKILDLYNEWNKKIIIYSKLEETPIEIKDPESILDFMKKYTKITTNESSQEYIRKIITSAN